MSRHQLPILWLSAAVFAVVCACDSDDDEPVDDDGIPAVEFIEFGTYHLCVIDEDGQPWCTGQNHFGQLGDGTVEQQSELTEVTGLANIRGLSVGYFDATCAYDEHGAAYCWGNNARGLLADRDLSYSSTPVRIEGLPPVVDIDVGTSHVCAVTEAGQLYCWGNHESGQLGLGEQAADGEVIAQPRRVAGIDDVTGVAVGDEHTCAADRSDALYCWGSNEYGQVGLDLFGVLQVYEPRRIDEQLGEVHDFDVSFQHACATFGQRRQLHCWGRNQYGQFGLDDLRSRNKPIEVAEMAYVDEVATGVGQSCARIDDDVYCAGEILRPVNTARETGDGYFFRRSAALRHATELWGGALAVCGPADEHAVACRGVEAEDISGELFDEQAAVGPASGD